MRPPTKPRADFTNLAISARSAFACFRVGIIFVSLRSLAVGFGGGLHALPIGAFSRRYGSAKTHRDLWVRIARHARLRPCLLDCMLSGDGLPTWQPYGPVPATSRYGASLLDVITE